MFNLKTIATAAVTALVVVVLSGLVGGNQPDGVGGFTRFPNSDLSAATITSTGNFSAEGEANKMGSANSVNVLYFGAGDGCSAIQATASGTLTTTATSTSFCNS